MVWRMSLQVLLVGISTVSLPEQGCKPIKVLSLGAVQQRWQILPDCTALGSVLAAFPASIRNPYTGQLKSIMVMKPAYFLESLNLLVSRHVIHI